MPAEALAEAAPEVHAEPATTNLGDVLEDSGLIFKREMEKSQGKEEKPVAEPTAPAKAKPEPTEEAKTDETKPASALEAALSQKSEEGKVSDDPLKDVPETLPNEGRKDHWANARNRMKADHGTIQELQAKVKEYEAKVQTAGTPPPELVSELEKTKAENAELRDAITAANVELLPEYQKKYKDGEKALLTTAQEKTKAYGGNPEALADALHLPEGRRRDSAIAEALGEEMSDTGRTKINLIVAELDKLRDEANSERENSQQAYQRHIEKKQAEQLQEQQESEGRKQATFEAVTKRLTTEVPTIRLVDPSIPGAEDWNAGIKQDFADAHKLFGPEAKAEDTVAAAVMAKRYPRIEKLLLEKDAEVTQLKKQLAEFDSAQPDVKGGKAPVKGGKDAILETDPGKLYEASLAKTGGED